MLLQTARVSIFNPANPVMSINVRLIFDSGSQRSYVTDKVKQSLSLNRQCVQTMLIKTFGSDKGSKQQCDVVSLGLNTWNGDTVQLSFLSVPLICDPISDQPITCAMENYEYLANLDLADYSSASDLLEVDVLIGSDHYWKLVMGEVIRNDDGPMAIQTKFGWVLSGPVQELSCERAHPAALLQHTP